MSEELTVKCDHCGNQIEKDKQRFRVNKITYQHMYQGGTDAAHQYGFGPLVAGTQPLDICSTDCLEGYAKHGEHYRGGSPIK